MHQFYKDSWLQFNRSAVKVLIAMVLLLVGLTVSYAWFTDSDNMSTDTDTSNIYVDLTQRLSEITIIAPNQTISVDEMVYIQGRPTTSDAYIRVRYKAYIGADEVTHLISPLLYIKAEYQLQNEKSWIYSPADQSYYFVGFTNESTRVIFCNGFHVDEKFPKAFANKTVIFEFIVDAIQRSYRAYETDEQWRDVYPEEWSNMLDKYDININQVDDTIDLDTPPVS